MQDIGVQSLLTYEKSRLVGWMFTVTAAAYNLVRIPKLLTAEA